MCDLAEVDVRELVAALRTRLLKGSHHSGTTGAEAAESLVEVKSAIDLLQAESTALARVVQRTGHWREDGSRSDVAWLERLLKFDHGTAFDEMKIARVLDDELPVLASAYRAGEVSRGHVVAVIKRGARRPLGWRSFPSSTNC